jgi:IS5 family transposase
MRKKYAEQLPLPAPAIDHPKAKELDAISCILDENATMVDRVLQDLGGGTKKIAGANGMSAEQVLRAAIVKQLFGLSYHELAFHLADSTCLRNFTRIGLAGKPFKRSALAKNIKRINPETWQHLNRQILVHAADNKTERAREVRIDCTVVDSNIHPPTDSSLLFDVVRVVSRICLQVKERWGLIAFQDHRRRAKRRMLNIQHAKRKKHRKAAYKDLLAVTKKTVGYGHRAIDRLAKCPDVEAIAFSVQLNGFLELGRQVIDQTERRVLRGEKVPASEKIVSIFEPHTDIVVKDRRDTLYGHKVCLSVGASNLITDCVVTDGNPADSSLTTTMIERQKQIYGRAPLKVALDGGFASRENLKAAKECGVKDVCFAKRRGIRVEDMCRSVWVYKRLRRFRAGVEGVISWTKRCFGLSRCNWKGRRSFNAYVWLSILSANVLTLARKQTA